MKHKIEHIRWLEMVWQRPYQIETVWEALTHLATLTPRGAVVWEVRGCNGNVTHLLGADQKYIGKIKEVFRTHGDTQFQEVAARDRQQMAVARSLKISHPQLSLNTNTTESVIRAGLAALAEDKSGREVVLQIVLGRAYAPAQVSAVLQDPTANWLEIITGCVSKATTEAKKSVREKADQHSFQAAIRIGASGKEDLSRLRSVISALKVLESAGVRIRDEAVNPAHLNSVYVPWHFPLRLSVKELSNFLLLPAGEEEFVGTPGLHPKLTLPPTWYRQPTSLVHDRSFAVSMDMTPKKLSISPGDSLEHTHLIGPTGSGKSTAMQHLILADIKAGRSVLVIDPKADLVNDILARIPEERAADVVVIDPSDCIPVGLNPLSLKNPRNKALIADAILSVLKELWRDSWGVRIQDILSAALLTLIEIDDASLLWLPPLLTDEHFRRKITKPLFDAVPTTDWGQPETLEHWREAWAAMVNAKFVEKGLPCRVDHRSYERQGVDTLPTIHEGVAVRQMEAKGITTDKGDFNRWIRKANDILRNIRKKVVDLTDWIKAIKEELSQPQAPTLAALLTSYYEGRNAGAWSRNAKIGNLKNFAEAINYLTKRGIVTLEDLEAHAHEMGIDVTIDIPDPVSGFSMDTVDLARILGIFLDNAVEAALEAEQPRVGLNIIQNQDTLAIIISNSLQDNELALHKLKQQGFTTKEGHMGIGLANAQKIIRSYDNILWETTKQGGCFTQYLEIARGKE